MAEVLIIDDEKTLCIMLRKLVEEMGHQVKIAHTIKDGLKAAAHGNFDVVYLDVVLPDGNGLEALPKIRETKSCPEIIIMTGMGDPDGAELAIKNNAWDYIVKPSSLHTIMLPLVRALQFREANKAQGPRLSFDHHGIAGNSRRMRDCIDLMAKAAHSETGVLIVGETGTGKELFASAIHRNSVRADGPFIVVDCAGLTQTLAESILFGHEKGAFTGAERAREGLIRLADQGTLFLDEIGELPPTVQKNFLRVLQEHRFRPLGSKKEYRSDFRVIAATNRDLNAMVANGDFRKDLLYRIDGFSIELPPLRERRSDISVLTLYYMGRICERYGVESKGISTDLLEALMNYDWPGNVRELFNTLERTFTVANRESTLFSRHLPDNIRIKLAQASLPPDHNKSSRDGAEELLTLQEYRDRSDENYLRTLLATADQDIKEACRISGMSRSRLYALLNKYGLSG